MKTKRHYFNKSDEIIFEKMPMEKISKAGKLTLFHHEEFWQCMDTKRDGDNLEVAWNIGNYGVTYLTGDGPISGSQNIFAIVAISCYAINIG